MDLGGGQIGRGLMMWLVLEVAGVGMFLCVARRLVIFLLFEVLCYHFHNGDGGEVEEVGVKDWI